QGEEGDDDRPARRVCRADTGGAGDLCGRGERERFRAGTQVRRNQRGGAGGPDLSPRAGGAVSAGFTGATKKGSGTSKRVQEVRMRRMWILAVVLVAASVALPVAAQRGKDKDHPERSV